MGSADTGDDLVAGEINGSTNETLIVANLFYDGIDRTSWRGHRILLVTPTGDIGNRPHVPLDGIVGVANRGGAGVRGVGNQPEGPRGETAGSGTGGDGVVGHGGTGDLETSVTGQGGFNPGIGVLGIGGYWTGPAKSDGKARDDMGGPGVIGVAGGDQGPAWVPPFNLTKGVGVYGASSQHEGVVAQGGPNASGLRATGFLGVQGDGTNVGVQGKGNIGVTAYGEDFGIIATGTNRAGIEVEGPIGIRATALYAAGTAGVFHGYAGIRAKGDYDPGGTFEGRSTETGIPMAQVQLVPLPMWVPDEEPAPFVEALPPSVVDRLPARGNAGDLLATIRTDADKSMNVSPGAPATLWFCTVSGSDVGGLKPATWRQVLLGPEIVGLANDFRG
jgi:hypothetical protein